MTKYLLILILSLSIALGFSVNKCSNQRNIIKIDQANEKAYTDSMTITKDAAGRIIAEKYVLQKQIIEITTSTRKEIEELREDIKGKSINIKNLKSISSVEEKVNPIVYATKYVVKDSTYHFILNPEYKVEVKINKDSAYMIPYITNTQTVALFDKRETVRPRKKFFLFRWFQKRHTVMKAIVKNSNKAIIITDINAAYIIKK